MEEKKMKKEVKKAAALASSIILAASCSMSNVFAEETARLKGKCNIRRLS